MKFLKILKLIYFAVTFSISSSALAHPDPAASEMTDAANAFLATLKPDQKAKAIFKLDDNNRTRWHFVPTEMHSRHGLSFREMQQDQQHMAYSLLASIMSVKGDNFKKEFLKTNNEGYFKFFFKKGTKYLIDSVVIIEGSNKKKDNYAKWHSLWASYTLQTPDL